MQIAKTDRTEIDSICLADASFFLELVNSPTWLRYIGDRNVRDLAAAEEYLTAGLLRHDEEHGFGYYVVRTKQGTAIGICGFLKRPFLEFEDFGFAYLPAYQGLGYGFEAGQAVLDFGIEQLGFEQLDAITNEENAPSIRLLEKLGFSFQRVIHTPEKKLPTRLYRWRK